MLLAQPEPSTAIRGEPSKALLSLGLAVVLALSPLGCLSTPHAVKFDASRPIEITPYGRFEQDGQPLDSSDLGKKLRAEDEAGHDARRASAFGTAGQIFGSAGGAMMGIPLGQKAGGEPEPLWVLGIVGVAVAAGAIALGVVGDNATEAAVRAHNHEYAQRHAADEERERDYRRRHPKVPPALPRQINPEDATEHANEPTIGSTLAPEPAPPRSPPPAPPSSAPARPADSGLFGP
jgi:hypothetical protein